MLNEDLIDPKDVEIFKLKKTIEDFKKYDEERKKYYKESLRRLGELESYMQELEDAGKNNANEMLIAKLQKKVTNQKTEISRLKSIIELNRLEEIITPEELAMVKSMSNKTAILKENRHLRDQIKLLKNTINQLLAKLNEKQ